MKFPYVELPRNPSPAFPNATTTLQPQIPVTVQYGEKCGFILLDMLLIGW